MTLKINKLKINYKKVTSALCTCLALSFVNVANANEAKTNNHNDDSKRFAITNAKVYTATKAGVLEKATVVVEGEKIVAVHLNDAVPSNLNTMTVIDAQGRILTPGFIGSMNTLGLVEVSAVAGTRDGYDDKADVTLDNSLAFNPKSTLIAYTRKGGITNNIVSSHAGDGLFSGQTFTVNLSGDYNSVVAKQNGVIIYLGTKSKGSRAKSLQGLDNLLADAQEKLNDAKQKQSASKKPIEEAKASRKEQVTLDLLSAKKPLVAYVDRASDILALLTIKKKYNLNVILVGASDAVLIKDEIVKAQVPIIMSPLKNLPGNFDSLHASLTNAAQLSNAGVNIIFSPNGDAHNLNQLRFDAGIAVANGFDYVEAIKALTANVADAFQLNAGRIEVGKQANIVLWSADPFELSSGVQQMWINGIETSTVSRQDALRDRYMTKSDMPEAYLNIKQN